MIEFRIDEKGMHPRIVYYGSEETATSWATLFCESKRNTKSLCKTWIVCDMEWAEYIGFAERSRNGQGS